MPGYSEVMTAKDFSTIRALTFDVFGTVVDWRSTVAEEARELGAKKGIDADWDRFADAWRGTYRPYIDRVRRGELPWTSFHDLHRMSLDEVLGERGIPGFTGEEKDALTGVWHRLRPWPDAVAGLTRLRERYVVSTLSNGNVSLLIDVSKQGGLTWDCVLSCELMKAYKPDKDVYLMATRLLGLRPDEVMMVAAHKYDLYGAQSAGLKTAFVPRPLEFGPGSTQDLSPDPSFDVVASDFIDLARQLSA